MEKKNEVNGVLDAIQRSNLEPEEWSTVLAAVKERQRESLVKATAGCVSVAASVRDLGVPWKNVRRTMLREQPEWLQGALLFNHVFYVQHTRYEEMRAWVMKTFRINSTRGSTK